VSEDTPGPARPLRAAVAALRAGAVVAIPTDTVYGLAVDPSCSDATDALFAVKARPESLDLPVLIGSIDQGEALAGPAGLSPTARRLAGVFWPGALTLVVPRRHGLRWSLGSHADTIGLRIPDHPVARALCAEVGPLATTSANMHGAAPCTDADEVRRAFGPDMVVVDGGRCAGAPSTVVSLLGATPVCLRIGALSWADVTAVAAAEVE
jgi:L-threonylcarbamoyladenylate synthase